MNKAIKAIKAKQPAQPQINTYDVIIKVASLIRKNPRAPIALALKAVKTQEDVVKIYTEYEKTGLVPERYKVERAFLC